MKEGGAKLLLTAGVMGASTGRLMGDPCGLWVESIRREVMGAATGGEAGLLLSGLSPVEGNATLTSYPLALGVSSYAHQCLRCR